MTSDKGLKPLAWTFLYNYDRIRSYGGVSERFMVAGHPKIVMDTYSHVLPGLQEEAAKKFEAVLQEAKVQNEIEHIAKQHYEKS